jgi:hypothetical protein
MPLTKEQKVANGLFFEKMFRQLNPNGGIWQGDDGMMRRQGDVFMADLETYTYIRQVTPELWFNKRVVLFMDTTKSAKPAVQALAGKLISQIKK